MMLLILCGSDFKTIMKILLQVFFYERQSKCGQLDNGDPAEQDGILYRNTQNFAG